MSLEVLLQNSPWMSGLNAAEQNKVRADIQIKQIPAEGYCLVWRQAPGLVKALY